MRRLVTFATTLALAGCAASPPPVVDASAIPEAREPFRPPPATSAQGSSGILGEQAPAVLARFGNPRIDLTEGDARKLQFASDDCVVDIFFYPSTAGSTPVASHLAARRRADGTAVAAQSCLDQIRSR